MFTVTMTNASSNLGCLIKVLQVAERNLEKSSSRDSRVDALNTRSLNPSVHRSPLIIQKSSCCLFLKENESEIPFLVSAEQNQTTKGEEEEKKKEKTIVVEVSPSLGGKSFSKAARKGESIPILTKLGLLAGGLAKWVASASIAFSVTMVLYASESGKSSGNQGRDLSK